MNTILTAQPRKREAPSIVVSVYNEETVLPDFHWYLSAVLQQPLICAEIIDVSDGSRDCTRAIIRDLRGTDARIAVVDMSRNFGKEAAMTAGLDHAKDDVAVVIDAGLQVPSGPMSQLVGKRYTGDMQAFRFGEPAC